VTDAHGSDGFAFPSGKLKYQRALALSPWLEDGEGDADVGVGPIGEGGMGRERWDGNFLETVIERLG